MRLQSLQVWNFRAIAGESNKIDFADNNIIFLFGKNNIGKSSVLHAYKYFASPNQLALITDFHDHNDTVPIVIEATYLKEEQDAKNFEEKGLNKWVDQKGEIRFRKSWGTVGNPAKKETFNPLEDKFNDGGFGGIEPILTNAIPNIIYIEAMPSVESLTTWLEKEIKNKLLKKLKDNHAAEYQAALTAIEHLQEKVEGEDYLGKIKDGANKYFAKTFPELELRIRATPYKEADLSKAFEKDFSVTIGKKSDSEAILAQAVETLEELNEETVEEKKKDSILDRQFDLHGHGLIRQAIINILGMFKDSKENEKHTILFEEPELYLHPSNKRKFKDTLYDIAEQDNYQIICVSHDPQLIDLSRPHTSLARFVKIDDNQTVIYQAGDNIFAKDVDTKDRIQMLNRFNPHICETFFSDEVILVEGDTEAIVLRELLEKNYRDREIFVVNTGSKNNIPFFIQVLSHFKITQHIIHDSDERYLYENGELKKNANGEPKKNSAWTLNETIWESINLAKASGVSVGRFVSIRNFEHAHGYSYNPTKGKPLSAHEYARSIDFSNDHIPIVKFIKQITGDLAVDTDYSFEYLEQHVNEPNPPQ